jgi:poly(hydroxyalkanoate) granule-associated protein
MARKSKNRTSQGNDSGDAQQAIRDSAQKIWLAGLGAFERAKTDGPRMFETLVEQGRNMGARAVGAADEALKNIRQANYGGMKLDKLEQVFEERVSKSLQRLGVLTSREVEALSRQVEELNETVRNMAGRSGGAKRAAGATRKRKTSAAGGTARKAKTATKAKAKRATRGSRARQA